MVNDLETMIQQHKPSPSGWLLKLPFVAEANEENLLRICVIRAIVLFLLASSSIIGLLYLDIEANATTIASLLLLYALLTLTTALRLRSHALVSTNEFTVHLFTEVAFIAFLVFFTGGATNPFISYLLVPISIAAATLSTLRTVGIAALAIAAYSILLFYYQPLAFFSHNSHSIHLESLTLESLIIDPTVATKIDNSLSKTQQHDHHIDHTNKTPSNVSSSLMPTNNISLQKDHDRNQVTLNPHYLGMWLNFVVSALLISWFVAKMAEAINQQHQAINKQRETQLQDEQILAVATVAAGTAHEIATPLNTLKLIIDEIDSQLSTLPSEQTEIQQTLEDIQLMKQQIHRCQQSLSKLVNTARESQPGQAQNVQIGPWLVRCIENWQPLHPDIKVNLLFEATSTTEKIRQDLTLNQAVANILDNASNASSDNIEIALEKSTNTIDIIINDNGSGIPEHIIERQGSPIPVNLETNRGLGLGIFLSNSSINRLGGQLIITNRSNPAVVLTTTEKTQRSNGTQVRIRLPIQH